MTTLTPGAQSQTSGSQATNASDTGPPSEKDPFLSLLEQLAENEQNSQGGPSELDFFLSGGIEGEGEASDAVAVVQVDADGDALVGLEEGVNTNKGGENASSSRENNNNNHADH